MKAITTAALLTLFVSGVAMANEPATTAAPATAPAASAPAATTGHEASKEAAPAGEKAVKGKKHKAKK